MISPVWKFYVRSFIIVIFDMITGETRLQTTSTLGFPVYTSEYIYSEVCIVEAMYT